MNREDILKVGACALVFNLMWEFSHYKLYVDFSGISLYPHLILASCADAILILFMFAGVFARHKNWPVHPKQQEYLLIFAMGILIAAINEIINLKLGRWEYTSNMPLLFGIGVSPLFQLGLTGMITLLTVNHIKNRCTVYKIL